MVCISTANAITELLMDPIAAETRAENGPYWVAKPYLSDYSEKRLAEVPRTSWRENLSTRYGDKRIKRGLMHFFLGKGVSAIAGLVAMLLVVRSLSIADFARYSVLVALVELFTAISGLGLVQVLLRYVPELYATFKTRALQKLFKYSFALRSAALISSAAITWFFPTMSAV